MDKKETKSLFEFPVRVTAYRCANGETWAYRVWMGSTKVGETVYRTLRQGDSQAEHALAALRKVLAVAE